MLSRSNTDDHNLVDNVMNRYRLNMVNGSANRKKSLNPNIFRTTIMEQEEEQSPKGRESTKQFDLL